MLTRPGEDTGMFDPEKTTYVFQADGTGTWFTIPIHWSIDGARRLHFANVGPENPDPAHPYYRGDMPHTYTLSGDTLTLVSIDRSPTTVVLYRKR
jgi:hypothetical protein